MLHTHPLISYFKINDSLFGCPSFLKEYLNPQARTEKMANKLCRLQPQSLRIKLENSVSYTIDPLAIQISSDVFRSFGKPVYWFGCPNSDAQKTHFKFSFSVVFLFLFLFKVAINDIKMHLIILKQLTRQKYRQTKKNNETRRGKKKEAKEETVYKTVFIYLNK